MLHYVESVSYTHLDVYKRQTIDWEKVREGIRKQIKYLVESDEKDSRCV